MSGLELTPFDDGDRDRWDRAVETCPDGHVFQRWAWGELQRGLGAEPFRIGARRADGVLAGGVQVLVFDTGSRTFAYVPRGPAAPADDPDLAALLVDAAVEVSLAAGATLVRIEPQWEWSDAAAARFVSRGFAVARQHIMPPRTIVVDLSGPIDSVWAAFRSTTRNRVRVAQKRGVQVRPALPDEMATFVRLMNDTNARHGLRLGRPDQYLLAAEHFGSGGLQLFLASADGQDVAGIVVFACGGTATYLWGASSGDEGARHANPNQLLHWTAMQWARDRGCRWYDLFGVPDFDEDVLEREYARETGGWWNLYRFKRGFGGRVHRHAGTYDLVVPAE